MSIFFTSDTHFGHKNIIKFCPWSRGFLSSVDEMNERLIKDWNDAVSPNDDVYHLGDFAFMGRSATKEMASALNGNIHFIIGNHDKQILENADEFMGLFASMQHYKEIQVLVT